MTKWHRMLPLLPRGALAERDVHMTAGASKKVHLTPKHLLDINHDSDDSTRFGPSDPLYVHRR